jgi:hypothetical protein
VEKLTRIFFHVFYGEKWVVMLAWECHANEKDKKKFVCSLKWDVFIEVEYILHMHVFYNFPPSNAARTKKKSIDLHNFGKLCKFIHLMYYG